MATEKEKNLTMSRQLSNLKRRKSGLKVKRHFSNYFKMTKSGQYKARNELKTLIKERFKLFGDDEIDRLLLDTFPNLSGNLKYFTPEQTFQYQQALKLTWNSMDRARKFHQDLGHNPFAPKNQIVLLRKK